MIRVPTAVRRACRFYRVSVSQPLLPPKGGLAKFAVSCNPAAGSVDAFSPA
jgi:hypothetical protein